MSNNQQTAIKKLPLSDLVTWANRWQKISSKWLCLKRIWPKHRRAETTLPKQGANVATSPVDASKEVDMVITMLPAGQHVKEVYLGKDGNQGLLDVVGKDTLLVDSSTIAASDAREVAQVAADKGIQFMDAPVSGGTAGQQQGHSALSWAGKLNNLSKSNPF